MFKHVNLASSLSIILSNSLASDFGSLSLSLDAMLEEDLFISWGA